MMIIAWRRQPQGWVDAWECMGRPAEQCYTYDGKQNPVLNHRFRNRFDRCFVLTRQVPDAAGQTLVPSGRESTKGELPFHVSGFQLDGKEPIGDETLERQTSAGRKYTVRLAPSDHFALAVTLAPGPATTVAASGGD